MDEVERLAGIVIDREAEVNRLRTEVERLTRERDHAIKTAQMYMDGNVFRELEAQVAALRGLLTQWHESWQRGDEGDALDAPTRALLAEPSAIVVTK